jgi:L-alanine-DL-glutamate epimerase-like enolase superfamily enzyme
MRVTHIEVRSVTRPMPGGQRNARRTWTEKAFLFCFVTAEDGAVGVGEGWTSYASTRALAATIEDDVAPLALGREVEALLEGAALNRAVRDACVMSGRYGILAVALSAVEMALHDLAARAAGLPLWRHLGADAPRVPVYASGGLYAAGKSSYDLGSEAAGWVAGGHRMVKIKVGGAAEAEDLDRVAAVRAAVGPDVAVMVDAHYTLDPARAAALSRGLARHDVLWLEAPIRPDDWRGHDALVSASAVALCGNETLPWRDGFERLAEAGVRYLMPDVSACGGIAETLAVGTAAEAAGMALTLHSSSSIVLFLASLHVAASCPATHSVEMHRVHRWFEDLAPKGALVVTDGAVTLGDAPGIGVDPAGLRAQIDAGPTDVL